uniref:Tyrosine-protein kinase n=1 Tax=Panagrellus redivivus TaxID=6233 RepID=A0A7E4VCE8_PANRE
MVPSSREFRKPANLNMSEPRVSRKSVTSITERTEKSTATATNKSFLEGSKQSKGNDVDDDKTLTHHEWYHGMMPRDEIEELLKKDGDFLVRKTDVANKTKYAVSVYGKGRIRHILLNYKDNQWAIRDTKRKTIIELIEAFVENKSPVQTDGTVLLAGAPRPDYYILHEHIELGKKLGGGAFGDVHIGVYKKANENVDVAIKMLKGVMHKKERCQFIKEARIMRKFNHPNLVNLIGIAPNETPMMIILELCPGGSLIGHLKKNPDLPKDKLTAYCADACRGMCYLSARKVIHRDIAARNCLLGKQDEVKISDFGLSVANTDVLKLDKLKQMPVRWLAPEVLKKGEFSTKSDVWAFAVTMWEIYSYCKTDPFPGESNAQAKQKIISGKDPMEPPEGTPTMMAAVMKLCFTQDPAQRPDFETVFKLICPKETPPAKDDAPP